MPRFFLCDFSDFPSFLLLYGCLVLMRTISSFPPLDSPETSSSTISYPHRPLWLIEEQLEAFFPRASNRDFPFRGGRLCEVPPASSPRDIDRNPSWSYYKKLRGGFSPAQHFLPRRETSLHFFQIWSLSEFSLPNRRRFFASFIFPFYS